MQENHLNKKTKIVVNRLLKLYHRKGTNEILGEARQSLVQQFNFRFFFFFLFTFSDVPPRCLCSKNTLMVRQVQTQLKRKCILCHFDRVRLSPYCSAMFLAERL